MAKYWPIKVKLSCLKWLRENFLVLKDSAKKSRKYELNPEISKNLFE